MRHACHKPRDQGARGRQGEEGVGEVPRVLLLDVYARTGTRRQRARDPGAWEGGQGRTRENERTRGRAGPGSGSREGQQGGRVASRIAPHRASARRGAGVRGRRREKRGRGTERKEAGDPATRDEAQGKERVGKKTGGKTGPGGRGRERGREGALPRELLRTVHPLAGGQRDREGGAEKGVTWYPTTGHWARQGAAACCHKAARPQRCSVLCACVVSCNEGRQGRGKGARAGRTR